MKTGLRRPVLRTLAAGLLLLLLLLVGLEIAVLAGGHSSTDQDADVVVILGAMVYESGPSRVLLLRMKTGLRYLNAHPAAVAVVSGAKGSDEPVSEAQAMADYLTDHGIPSERILLEDRSFNTFQNLSNTAALLREQGYDLEKTRVMVVTNGFHLTRVRMLAGRCDLRIGALAAPLPPTPGNTLYCYGREPLALIKSFLFDRVPPESAARSNPT